MLSVAYDLPIESPESGRRKSRKVRAVLGDPAVGYPYMDFPELQDSRQNAPRPALAA